MKRILIARPDRLGDTLISTACFEPLKKSGFQLFFMAREMMSPLFYHHPLLEEFIPIPNSPHPKPEEKQALLQKIKSLSIDAFIHLHPLPYLYPLISQTGIPQRIGLQHKGITHHLTDSLPYVKNMGTKHEAFYNFDLLTPLDPLIKSLFQNPEFQPYYSIHLNPDDELPARNLLPWHLDHTSYLVMNPTAHSRSLRWPVQHFIELAQRIREAFHDPFVIIGDSAEDPSVLELLSAPVFQQHTINLAGKTSLGTLAWILQKARLLVGRNTGPSHLAAAVGCPTVEIFGRMEAIYGPDRWHALGEKNTKVCAETKRRWYEVKQRFWKRSYASISPEKVYQAVLPLLNRE